jgi:hypothetical protein
VLLARALVVLFLELTFRLPPGAQVIVQVATVTATLDVNLQRTLTDFGQGWPVLISFFRVVRPIAYRHVLVIGGQI